MAIIDITAGPDDEVHITTGTAGPVDEPSVAEAVDFVRTLDPEQVRRAVAANLDSFGADPVDATIQVIADALAQWAGAT